MDDDPDDEEAADLYRRSVLLDGRDDRTKVGGREDRRQAPAWMVRHTAGLPFPAHEIGTAVWRTARTPEVRIEEVRGGIPIASDIIGRKVLEPRVFRAIRSERYQSILRKRTTPEMPRMS